MTVYGESLGVSYQVLQTPLNQDSAYYQPVYRRQAARPPQVMMIILPAVLVIVLFAGLGINRLFKQNQSESVQTITGVEPVVNSETAVSAPAVALIEGGISPVFSPQVQHWAPQIVAWSAQYGLDPDIVATIMQIESCGDPQAGSSACPSTSPLANQCSTLTPTPLAVWPTMPNVCSRPGAMSSRPLPATMVVMSLLPAIGIPWSMRPNDITPGAKESMKMPNRVQQPAQHSSNGCRLVAPVYASKHQIG